MNLTMVDVNSFDASMGAVVLPPIIALSNQHRWNPQLKGLVALMICFVYSGVVELMRGPLDFHAWRQTALTVSVSALGAYKLFWQPSQIGPAIEKATSFDEPPVPPLGPAGPGTTVTVTGPAPAVALPEATPPPVAVTPDPPTDAAAGMSGLPTPAPQADVPAGAPTTAPDPAVQALLADYAARNGYVKAP